MIGADIFSNLLYFNGIHILYKFHKDEKKCYAAHKLLKPGSHGNQSSEAIDSKCEYHQSLTKGMQKI